METIRKLEQVIRSKPTVEGAGVRLNRVFGFQHTGRFDPFLLLDDFSSPDPADYLPGFPWHPHRGIETITYILAGEVEHGDSLGNTGVICPGEVQWMTAGSGIIHQEMPRKRGDGLLKGFQLWANLPARDKMMAPRYREIKADQIPSVELKGGITVRVISGTVEDVRGPVRDVVTDPVYLDISLHPRSEFCRRIPEEHTALAYVIEGSACFGREEDPYAHDVEGRNYFDLERGSCIRGGSLAVLSRGDSVFVKAGDDGARLLLLSGRPIGEPVAWQGPIVMNTREELRTAFRELQEGSFIKTADSA
ncbi:MAG: pirin family protein [Spirochaetales bacterium]|nr:pirin family protein [Spirochaetales bacterium]